MLCYIFPALSLHCITSTTIQERVSFFTSFTRVNGSECASVSEQSFFFLFFLFWIRGLLEDRDGGEVLEGGRGDLGGRRERKRSRRRAEREKERESCSKARGHVNLGKM